MSRTPLLVALVVVLAAVTSGAVAAGVPSGDGTPASTATLQADDNSTATPTPTPTPDGNGTNTTDSGANATGGENTTDENGSFGIAVASFAQASAAQAEGDVEQGMFEAAVNRTNGSARAAVVERRTNELSDRVAELRAERAAILNDSDLPAPARRAKAARITARVEELRNGINETDSVARRVGVNETRLDRLREEAAELSGPEVADIARGIARDPGDPGFPGAGGGPPGADGERGPPGEEGDSDMPVDIPAGPSVGIPGQDGNETDPAARNRTAGDRGNRTARPGGGQNGTDARGNVTDAGGNGTETGGDGDANSGGSGDGNTGQGADGSGDGGADGAEGSDGDGDADTTDGGGGSSDGSPDDGGPGR